MTISHGPQRNEGAESHPDAIDTLRDKSKPITDAVTRSLSTHWSDAMLDASFDAKTIFEQRSLIAGIDMALTQPNLSLEDQNQLRSFQDRIPGYSPEIITGLYRDFLKWTQIAQEGELSPAAILAMVLGTALVLSNQNNGNQPLPPSPHHDRPHHHHRRWAWEEEQRRQEWEMQRRREFAEQRRREWEIRQRRIQQEREWERRFRYGR